MAAIRNLKLSRYEAKRVLMPEPSGRGTLERIRVTVFGEYFPERAIEPEILVGKQSAFGVRVSPDQHSISGFLKDAPADGAQIVVRYGDSQEGSLKSVFDVRRVKPLPKECA